MGSNRQVTCDVCKVQFTGTFTYCFRCEKIYCTGKCITLTCSHNKPYSICPSYITSLLNDEENRKNFTEYLDMMPDDKLMMLKFPTYEDLHYQRQCTVTTIKKSQIIDGAEASHRKTLIEHLDNNRTLIVIQCAASTNIYVMH